MHNMNFRFVVTKTKSFGTLLALAHARFLCCLLYIATDDRGNHDTENADDRAHHKKYAQG